MAENSFVTPSQAERYPHFTQLLKDLFEHRISATNFVTKSKNEQRQKVFQEYQKTKNEFEAVKLVYDSIWDVIADSSLEEDVRRFSFCLISCVTNPNYLFFAVAKEIGEISYII